MMVKILRFIQFLLAYFVRFAISCSCKRFLSFSILFIPAVLFDSFRFLVPATVKLHLIKPDASTAKVRKTEKLQAFDTNTWGSFRSRNTFIYEHTSIT